MPDRDGVPGQSERSDCPFLLSERQIQVLHLAAQGMTDQQIGLHLGLSPWTVHAHLAGARRVLCAQNTTQAVAIALTAGVIKYDAKAAGWPADRRGERVGNSGYATKPSVI